MRRKADSGRSANRGRERNVRIPARACQNGAFLEALAAAGVGIAFEPDFVVGPDLKAGRLVKMLRTFLPVAAAIHVVYPSRRHLSAKVRAFTDSWRNGSRRRMGARGIPRKRSCRATKTRAPSMMLD